MLARQVKSPRQQASGTRREDSPRGSPGFHRFISEDPIGFAGGDVNLYAYVFNSPTNYTDPSGENPFIVACAIDAAIEIGADALSGRKMTAGSVLTSGIRGCVFDVATAGLSAWPTGWAARSPWPTPPGRGTSWTDGLGSTIALADSATLTQANQTSDHVPVSVTITN